MNIGKIYSDFICVEKRRRNDINGDKTDWRLLMKTARNDTFLIYSPNNIEIFFEGKNAENCQRALANIGLDINECFYEKIFQYDVENRATRFILNLSYNNYEFSTVLNNFKKILNLV